MSSTKDEIRITILVDNLGPDGLAVEHGFSAWVEAGGRRVLFDTGQGSALGPNAQALGVDLATADAVVLSHGHYDHTGALPLALGKAPRAQVYGHPAVLGPKYAIRGGPAKDIGMPAPSRAALDAHPGQVHWSEQPQELAPGLGLTGAVPRNTDYEDTGGPFFEDTAGETPDQLLDDQALWLRTERGLVVLEGCSHSGVVNTIEHALRLSGETRLHAVMGGFHLLQAAPIRLARTMKTLQELSPDLIVPCHCTGQAAVETFRQAFGERVAPGSVGTLLRFPAT